MQSRGRSRLVAESAMARASANIVVPVPVTPASTSPLLRPSFCSASPPSTETSGSSSPDYDSQPPTPVTIEDQLFEAYVAEDLITAKRLLLRLKGIEVTSDDDPRIAEVQDEDFDFCFVPNGGLRLEPEHEKAIQDAQRQWERQERLRACEMKWENEKRRMREERMAVLKARELKWQEEERRRRRRAEKEARRLSQEERWSYHTDDEQNHRHTTSRAQRRVLSPSLLGGGPSSRRNDEAGPSSAAYDFMSHPSRNPPCRITHEDRAPLRSRSHHDIPLASHYPHIHPTPAFDDSRAVPFSDVVQSMQGDLFPVTNEERRSRARRKESPSPSTSRPRTCSQIKRMRENDLLQCLLDGIDQIPTTDVKGKGKAIRRPKRLLTAELCAACKRSPSSASSSASSPTSSRISWLSFRSSTSSVSTAATTPSSSPGWFKSSSLPRRQSSWLSTTSSTSSQSHEGDACDCLRRTLVPVDISETPLASTPGPALKASPYAAPTLRRTTSATEGGAVAAKELVHVVSSTVSHFLDIVHGFQQAYVTAAQFSVAASGDVWEERSFSFLEREDGTREVSGYGKKSTPPTRAAEPAARRVSVRDVAYFLAEHTDSTFIDNTLPEDPRTQRGFRQRQPSLARYFTHIPLLTREEAEQEPVPPPSTVLPNPLPYKLHFKPLPKPAQSPRCLSARIAFQTAAAQAESDDTMPACTPVVLFIPVRVRAVANPQFWRIKAALNVTRHQQRRCALPRPLGVSDPKVTHHMGAGWEGMKGFAFEGIGHSPLSLYSYSAA
ncbi:hypothetical protein BKA70DRAFT_1251322 [Coprinopsis sp. MPI-PUGE-AT-0042]|nr:hypothetical protein BKA70DRAFT_1251322 [Coprinopsis sp. MPI-PUGE-AT-0042]